MSNIYCDIDKVPKGKVRGTYEQCLKSGQVTYWGKHVPKSKKKTIKEPKIDDIDNINKQITNKINEMKSDIKNISKYDKHYNKIEKDKCIKQITIARFLSMNKKEYNHYNNILDKELEQAIKNKDNKKEKELTIKKIEFNTNYLTANKERYNYNNPNIEYEGEQLYRYVIDAMRYGDYYATPLEYSSYIYDMADVKKTDKILDIGAGLASLSYDFLLNYKSGQRIDFIEMFSPFRQQLRCFEKKIKSKIYKEGNFMDIKKLDYDYNIILSNPPFSGQYLHKTKSGESYKTDKKFYLPWILHIFELIDNYKPKHHIYIYIIMPNTLFTKSLTKNKDGSHKETNLDSIQSYLSYNVFKNLQSIYGIWKDIKNKNEYENEFEPYFTARYLKDVKGFSKIAKNGKPSELKSVFGLYEFISFKYS